MPFDACTPADPRFAVLRDEVHAAAQPATHLERWFANEILHASWDLDRVRDHRAATAATAAEPQLEAAYARASRDWNRARKELASIQTARVNHVIRLSPSRQLTAAATALADPARAPQPELSHGIVKHIVGRIGEGVLPVSSLDFARLQEAR